MSIRKHIPNCITSLNLLCGVVGITLALEGWYQEAFLCMIAGGIFASAAVTCHEGLRTAFSGSYLRLFVYATAMAVFVLTKYLFTRPHREGTFRRGFEAVLRTLSPLMLGVYILEPVLRPVVKPLLIGWLGESAGPIVTSMWYCVFGMAVYSGITWALKKVPGLRKIL